MLPFISYFGQQIPTYSLIGITAIVISATVAALRGKQRGYAKPDGLVFTGSDMTFIAAFAGIGAVAGGMLLFAVTQAPKLVQHGWLAARDFFGVVSGLFGGMVFYGGLFGSIGAVWFYCRFMKLSFGAVMKLVLPVFPLAHAIMRLGCFAAGCCYGIEHPPPFGVMFTRALSAPSNIHLLPVQLLEAFVNLAIFMAVWQFTKRERGWEVIAGLYGLMYSFMRFFIEFFRGDALRGFVFGLSTSQFISIFVFFMSGFVLIAYRFGKMQRDLEQ